MKFALSCIAGVESIAKKEIEKQGGIIEETTDRLIIFSGPIELVPRINLWSRVGNKLYILLGEKEIVKDFDTLFDLVSNISWKKYFKKNFPILVKATSIRSELSSVPTIQSIGQKAVLKNLAGDNFYKADENLEKMEILILVINNKTRILLNTSGNALSMRGYRKEAGEAPLKESLAAALVLLSGWKFREPFFDPFCGSGTIAIEALMIAKNIAPGIKRKFAYESWGIVPSETTENERILAKKKEYKEKYHIFASDIDEKMIKFAKENAKRAGLYEEIDFQVLPLNFVKFGEKNGTFVSNPPYGNRLNPENLRELYIEIDKVFRKNVGLNGGIISSFMEFDEIAKKGMYKKRKLYNGGEMCYFWKKV